MKTAFSSIWTALGLSVVLLVGCGGNSSDTPQAAAVATPLAPTGVTPVVPTGTTLSGSVVKGPVNGGTVTVRNAGTGAILGTTTTSVNGTYSLTIGYSGDVVLEAANGTYVDEATGLNTTLNQLKAMINTASGNQTVHLTPLTYIAYGYSGNTSTGFNTALNNLATQFGLSGTNLLTTLPVVTGTAVINDYGRVLRAMSQYVQTQRLASFESFIGQALDPATFTRLQPNFSAAFSAINPGRNLTFAFNGNGVSIGGTGAGGGTGTCGVAVTGNVTTQGFTVPLNLNYCISGIPSNACSASNTSLNQAVNGQGGAVGGVNLNYVYSSSCAPGAFAINLN